MKDRSDYRAMRNEQLIREIREQLDNNTNYKELATVLAERLEKEQHNDQDRTASNHPAGQV